MKQYKVSAWPAGGRKTDSIISANNVFDAKRIAAGIFNCKESEVQVREEK